MTADGDRQMEAKTGVVSFLTSKGRKLRKSASMRQNALRINLFNRTWLIFLQALK